MKKKHTHLIALTFFIFSSQTIYSQSFERMQVPFIVNGNTLANPLTGGLNSPQFSEVDLNNDGVLDLHVFDRVGEVHLTFLNQGTTNETDYLFAPEFLSNFPEAVNWVALRDFNQDGAYDMFTHGGNEGINGIRVFKGKFTDGKLDFERIDFDQSFPFNVLTISSGGNPVQIFVSNIDYSVFDDIDGDTDLDILTFNSNGGKIEWYLNRSIELGLGLDTLLFRLEDNCWGRVYESDMSQEITLSANMNDCPDNLHAAQDRHTGSTLLTYDADGDNDKDLIIGDITNAHLIQLTNGGTSDLGWMIDQDITFPSEDVPVDIHEFVASYYLDIDNDGLKDFIAAPNDVGLATPTYEVGWFYKNIGNTLKPIFELQQKDLLVNQMLDFGSNAYPTFVDVNGDKLKDLIVGNWTYYQADGGRDAYLFYFENVGSKSNPIFELKDDNWLNFNDLFSASEDIAFAFAPTFGDLDNDGDKDLLVGEKNGYLIFVENTAGKNAPMQFAEPKHAWQNINIGQNATPQIVDMNRDGLPDLVIGERRGKLNYFPNIGTASNPQFHPNQDETPNLSTFGQVFTNEFPAFPGFSTPAVLDFGDDFLMVTGSKSIGLQLHENIENNLENPFTLTQSNWGNILEGNEIAPAFADLNEDGLLEMAVGNRRGGFSIYHTNLPDNSAVSTKAPLTTFQLRVFPNPAQTQLFIQREFDTSDIHSYQIINALGQVLLEKNSRAMSIEINIEALAKGVYFLKIEQGGAIWVERWVKS